MGLTSGIAKVVSLGWIALIAWSIDRVYKLETDEPWDPPRQARPTRTLPFEGVALAGTPHASHLGGEAFAYASMMAGRPDGTVDPLQLERADERSTTLVAGVVVDRVLPALLEFAPVSEQIAEPVPGAESAGEAVFAIGPPSDLAPGEIAATDEVLEPRPHEPLAAAAEAAPSSGGARSYRVVKGDTLHRILKREFGKADAQLIKAVYEVNPQLKKNPNRIQVGADLQLPAWPQGAAMKQGASTGASS